MNLSEHSQTPDYSGSVVLVDDNDNLRQMLSLALETAGFDVVAASNEVDLQRDLLSNRPDALVINLQRYEADGLDLLVRMRARLHNVPILFLAGSDAEDFRYQAIGAGADWFGLRPLGMIDLANHIGELIRSGRPAARSQPREKQRRWAPRLKRTG